MHRQPYPSLPFMGIDLFSGDIDIFINNLISETSQTLHVHLIAVSTLNETRRSQSLSEKINSNGIALCDSKPVNFVISQLYSTFQRKRGSDFMREFIKRDLPTNSHFFLGGSEKTLECLVEEAKQINPSINIAGFFSPPFAEQLDVLPMEMMIKQANANIVWVGLGSPKQDLVAIELANRLSIRTIAVGAAFDFVSQGKREAPRILQDMGLEWAFRFANEPKRLWKRYFIGNITFLCFLPFEMIRLRKKIRK